MRYGFRCFIFCFALAAAVAACGASYTFAEKARSTSSASVIEPAEVTEGIVGLTATSFVSGVTGDLTIRIAAAVASALEDTGLEQSVSTEQEQLLTDCAGSGGGLTACGKGPAVGLLTGNPVNSINIGAVDAQAGAGNINVTIAYN
jgi:hypothetical protein